MSKEFSKSIVGEVAEGDVVVTLKYKGKTYAKAFRLNDPKIGNKIKFRIEATRRILCGF